MEHPLSGASAPTTSSTSVSDPVQVADGSLRLGRLSVDPPVVLAPMAGVTNAAFRTLCREQGAGIYVCEMITSRGLVERDEHSLRMLAFDPAETLRSVQLYGVDPYYMGEATRILCGEFGVQHVDLNFGCPVPKVTRKGGGAALPWKRRLLAAILDSTVAAASEFDVPVTMKTRKGIDDDHLTFLEAGEIAEASGCAAIGLHGRTAVQHYSGQADWASIAELAGHVSIPVLGNGDIWEAADAQRMMRETGCEGVIVGRGCLGRPWLFRDLAASFAGDEPPPLPRLGEVAVMMRRHIELLVHYLGDEGRGCAEFRKHVAWYLRGFSVGGDIRRGLALIDTIAEADRWLAQLDPELPFPAEVLGQPRGRQGSPQKRVVVPEGWMDARDDLGIDPDAESDVSGG